MTHIVLKSYGTVNHTPGRGMICSVAEAVNEDLISSSKQVPRYLHVKSVADIVTSDPTFAKGAPDTSSFTHRLMTLEGSPVDDHEDVEDELLPIALSGSRFAAADLIPKTTWGASLSNMLTDTSWQGIRHRYIDAVHGVCVACGTILNPPNAHELWDFYLPCDEIGNGDLGRQGIQRLSEVLILCPECHAMFHLGRAQIESFFDEAEARLMAVNGWDLPTCRRYESIIFERFKQHSFLKWTLDLSLLQGHVDGIAINIRWQPDESSGAATLKEMRPRNMNVPWSNSVRIVGIPWRMSREQSFRDMVRSPITHFD